MVLSGNFNSKCKSSVPDYDCCQKVCPNLNVKASKMIYTNIVIPLFTYCGTVNLNLSRTSVGKLDQIMNELLVSPPKPIYSS